MRVQEGMREFIAVLTKLKEKEKTWQIKSLHPDIKKY